MTSDKPTQEDRPQGQPTADRPDDELTRAARSQKAHSDQGADSDADTAGNDEASTAGALGQLKAERDQLFDRLQRTLAEFQNFRKQSEKRQGELRKFVIKDLVFQLLPIIDSFQSARAALEQDQSVEQVKDGVRFIHDMMLKFLADNRIEAIPSTGALFDPSLHEAVACEPARTVELNRVIREIQRGFRLDDLVIRHARVAVAVPPPTTDVDDDLPKE